LTAALDGQVNDRFIDPLIVYPKLSYVDPYPYLTNYDLRPCAGVSLIADKSVTTQSLAFLSYWYRKKRLQTHF